MPLRRRAAAPVYDSDRRLFDADIYVAPCLQSRLFTDADAERRRHELYATFS